MNFYKFLKISFKLLTFNLLYYIFIIVRIMIILGIYVFGGRFWGT